MMEPFQFHFNEHPVVAFILMLLFISGSLLMNFVSFAHDCVPFAQIGACGMTVYVGYKTLKKLSRDDKPGSQQ